MTNVCFFVYKAQYLPFITDQNNVDIYLIKLGDYIVKRCRVLLFSYFVYLITIYV